jgi:hypothetical protein
MAAHMVRLFMDPRARPNAWGQAGPVCVVEGVGAGGGHAPFNAKVPSRLHVVKEFTTARVRPGSASACTGGVVECRHCMRASARTYGP